MQGSAPAVAGTLSCHGHMPGKSRAAPTVLPYSYAPVGSAETAVLKIQKDNSTTNEAYIDTCRAYDCAKRASYRVRSPPLHCN